MQTELVASRPVSYGNDEFEEMKQKQKVDTITVQHEFEFDITNPTNKIQQKYSTCSQKICKVPRLAFALSMTLFVLILGNVDKFKSESTDLFMSILAIILSIMTIIFGVATLVYMWFEAKSISKFANIPLTFQKQRQILYEKINEIFGVVYEKGIYGMDRTKFGVTLISFVIYTSLNILLIESIFTLPSTIDCDAEETLQDPWFRGKCVVNKSSISIIYTFVYGLVVTASSYYHITEECDKVITTEREHLENKIRDTKIEQRYNEIKQEIQKWSDRQRRENRKLERNILCVVCFLYQFISYGIVRNEMFSGDINGGAVIFALYLYIGDAVMFAIVIFAVHEQIFYFYSLPKLIMLHLSHQFKAQNIKDIVLWWELRKYYLYCIIQLYTSGISGVIFAALFGSVICAVFGILTLGSFDPTVSVLFLFWTLYILYIAFHIVSQAVNFHSKQLSHFHTINKERLRLNAIQYYEPDNQQFDEEMNDKVFDIILDDIKENDKPIVVLGISMKSEFLLFLRASVLTVCIAAYFGS